MTTLLPVIVKLYSYKMYLLKHENCSHASVEGAPKVPGHASFSSWAVGARGSGGHHGLGGGTYEVAGTKIYEHILTEAT